MNCARILRRWVDPRAHDFDDKEAVSWPHASVDHTAFRARVARFDEWRGNELGRFPGESKLLELVDLFAVTLPQRTTASAMSIVGMLITHSLLALSRLNEQSPLLTTQASSGRSNSSMVCHDIAITFALPAQAVVNSATGPGPSRP